MPAVARLGDTGSHGGAYIGTITSGNPTVKTDGIETAFVGSTYYCPETGHGANYIISSPITGVGDGSETIAVVGSTTYCGATIDTGSPNTNAG